MDPKETEAEFNRLKKFLIDALTETIKDLDETLEALDPTSSPTTAVNLKEFRQNAMTDLTAVMTAHSFVPLLNCFIDVVDEEIGTWAINRYIGGIDP